MFLLFSPIPTEAAPPKGSYQNTCKDINVVGGTILAARCEKRDGTYEGSKLAFFGCEGDIYNDNGKLNCKKKPGKTPPSGSYQKSCKDISVDGNKLRAKCETRSGSWNKTNIKYKKCKGDISNNNGELSCSRGGGDSSNYPKGSYKKSCKNLYMEGKILEADCKNDKGRWKHSSIKYKSCNRGIWNDNGKLRCNN